MRWEKEKKTGEKHGRRKAAGGESHRKWKRPGQASGEWTEQHLRLKRKSADDEAFGAAFCAGKAGADGRRKKGCVRV